MEPGVEKSAILTRAGLVSLLDTLAVASVGLALAGSVAAAAGASWKVRAYFSVVAMLFDLLFTAEFFSRLASGERRWLSGIGSVVPLLAVSGPFLFGWAAADLGAQSVRGFWLAGPPAQALALAGVLRIVRLARAAGTAGAAPRLTPALAALVAACAILLAGAIAFDETLLPGPALADSQRRQTALQLVALTANDAERIAAAKAAGAIALRVDGRTLVSVAHFVSPADYITEKVVSVEAWFSADDRIRARSAIEAIIALAGFAAALAYALVLRFGIARGMGGAARGSKEGGRGPASQATIADAPAGVEELAGILGKRPR